MTRLTMLQRVSDHLSPQTVGDSTSDDDNNKKMYSPFSPPPVPSPLPRRPAEPRGP